MQKVVCCFLSVFLVAMVIGCSGDNVSLKGKVTFKEDGSPVPRGTVCFETESFRARGILSSDGTYKVGSLKENDGIPPGTYKVYIFGAEAPIEDVAGNMNALRAVPLVARKYTNAETSGITVQVDAKTKQFDFQVEKP